MKDKEFIYEVYKSMYDDRGQLINQEIENVRARQQDRTSNTTPSTGSRSRSVTQFAGGSMTAASKAKLKKLTYQDINQKYVMLNKLEAARSQSTNKKVQ